MAEVGSRLRLSGSLWTEGTQMRSGCTPDALLYSRRALCVAAALRRKHSPTQICVCYLCVKFEAAAQMLAPDLQTAWQGLSSHPKLCHRRPLQNKFPVPPT